MNHDLLSALQVSHPVLDSIVAEARAAGIAAKLTGSGGGGCVLMLVDHRSPLIASFKERGFRVHATAVSQHGVLYHAPARWPSLSP
jgi:mevalonate kinase